MNKLNVAVLVSGGGTNLQALIDAQNDGKIKSGQIKLVVSNKQSAYALVRAENAGIENIVIDKKKLGSQAEFERCLVDVLVEKRIDIIVLAGFMSILSADFCNRYNKSKISKKILTKGEEYVKRKRKIYFWR